MRVAPRPPESGSRGAAFDGADPGFEKLGGAGAEPPPVGPPGLVPVAGGE